MDITNNTNTPNTSTEILPQQPGRARRLAYGDIIRRRLRRISYAREPTVPDYGYERLVELLPVRVGVTLKTLIQTTTVKVVNQEIFCCICQEDSNISDIFRILSCGHDFHIKCIDTWLCENKVCPLCKKELSFD